MFDRNSFLNLVKKTDKIIFVKFSASWCGPCKVIKTFVDDKFRSLKNDALCLEIDIDESVDLYAMLKMKRMINGIPTILCYHAENETIYPDDSISGTDTDKIASFFEDNMS